MNKLSRKNLYLVIARILDSINRPPCEEMGRGIYKRRLPQDGITITTPRQTKEKQAKPENKRFKLLFYLKNLKHNYEE